MSLWKYPVLLGLVLFTSCSTQKSLEVRPTHLRDLSVESDNDPMLRGEQRKRFHGAVGVREMEQRLGHYYTVLWHDEHPGEPVRLLLEYQQGASGSRVLTQELDFDASDTEGRAEFQVIGDAYLKGGRVLAWKCTLFRGDREVASKRSYLWE